MDFNLFNKICLQYTKIDFRCGGDTSFGHTTDYFCKVQKEANTNTLMCKQVINHFRMIKEIIPLKLFISM